MVTDKVIERSPAQSSVLLGQSLADLTDWVQQQGQPAYRGRQLYDWIYHKGARSFADITVFPKQWREKLAEFPIGRSHLHYRSIASDGTIKYLLRLADNQIIETVGIPSFDNSHLAPREVEPPGSRSQVEPGNENEEWQENNPIANPKSQIPNPKSPKDRLTVCVSSQVGCPMDCDFCATGKGGYIRNLAPHEIIDQVLTVQADFNRRVSHIVFMGMGEPLLNTDNVLTAIHCLNKDVGIGQRSITLSTVGIPGHIQRLAQHQLQVTLAVSLHASNQKLREKLIPSAKHYPLEKLIAECREYVKITGRRISFEYIVLAELNDLPQHAIELANLVGGFQSHVNLIPYNPIQEVDYKRPDEKRIQAFVSALKQRKIAVSVRYSRGLEADAACGQLRASKS